MKRRTKYILASLTAVTFLVAWYTLAWQAQVFVLKRTLKTPTTVYVVEGSLPGVAEPTRFRPISIHTSASELHLSDDPFTTAAGQPVEYISIVDFVPSGACSFKVTIESRRGRLEGEVTIHHITLTLDGWTYSGYDVGSVS